MDLRVNFDRWSKACMFSKTVVVAGESLSGRASAPISAAGTYDVR